MNGDSYLVRLLTSAVEDIQNARDYVAGMTDEATAAAWQDGLRVALTQIAASPRGWAVAEAESALLNLEVQRSIYRRTRSSAAYLVFYTLEENPEDAPTIRILHVRHGSRAPLTYAEAQDILSNP